MGKRAASRNQGKEDSVVKEENDKSENKNVPIECGIVMPISEIDGCTADHWEQVREIIEEALDCDSIKTRLVSDADEVGIIHKRIVQNLYQNPIVVCDVSGKNPNVMFELGLRLAFDKPTVVIKDDETAYSFDTSPIEHIPYPRSLVYRDIVKFKKILREKVTSTLAESAKNPSYSTFLGSYQITQVAEIETKVVTPPEFYSNELEDIKRMIRQVMLNQNKNERSSELMRAAKIKGDKLLQESLIQKSEATKRYVKAFVDTQANKGESLEIDKLLFSLSTIDPLVANSVPKPELYAMVRDAVSKLSDS
ncbi:hypothetical protein [Gimesia chilikensis]|uniref:hypothetical protein n=1 Tax=Gimesia chilikensis TaxID=2605989 RepID=UPI00118C9793|nr:hypothetical protein [Gimesia chilikensis]QDT85572.1 hypothetical protein MalM14_32420 [Gimesia chilikensis]